MSQSTNVILVAAVSLLFAGAARAIEPPLPKVGMWETRIQHSGDGKAADPPAVMQRCLDEAGVARSKQTGDDYVRKNCSKYEVRQEGSTWIVDMACKSGATTTMTHSVTNVISANASHTEFVLTYEPARPGLTRDTTTIDRKWLGECKPQ